MIAKLKGLLDETGADWAVIDVAGVGYLVHCSSKTLAALGETGEACTVFTDLQVSENDMRLLGFATAGERDWFRLLTQVQGVGSKVALAILIALGPIFIALALFEPTRRFFHGWLGQAFNYIILIAVIIAITVLVADLGAAALAEAEAKSDVTIAAVIYAVYLFLGTIFFFQAPAIATGIAGGAAAGVGAFAGTAWGTMASPFRQRRIARNSRNLERAARRGGSIEAA